SAGPRGAHVGDAGEAHVRAAVPAVVAGLPRLPAAFGRRRRADGRTSLGGRAAVAAAAFAADRAALAVAPARARRPVRADVRGARVLAGQPIGHRARIFARRRVGPDGRDPDLLAPVL